MGRWTTGAITTKASNKLKLSYFLEKGYIRKGIYLSMPFRWTDNDDRPCGDIWLRVDYTGDHPFFELLYHHTSQRTGERTEMEYKVHLQSIPSNLGKGRIWYFICPVSGIRCRILYLAYGSLYFKAREAYQNRIYYRCQLSSKMDYANDRYWAVKRRVEALEAQKYTKRIYNGQPTRKAKLLERLWEDLDKWHLERCQPHCMPVAVRKRLAGIRNWDVE
ncbi:MAG: hypothetical protein AAFV95_28595 [Bacteroidota bacterium]